VINFRYHLVSLAAVLLALAVGIILGSGPLDDTRTSFGGSNDSAPDPALAGFEEAYAERTGSSLADGVLRDRSVVLLTTPDARTDEVAGITADLKQSGATITGTVKLTSKLLDPANRQFAEGVAQQAAGDDESVSSATDGYGRVGAAIARAYLGKGDVDDVGSMIASAFSEGELVATDEAPATRASLTLIVAGPGTSDTASGESQVVAQLSQVLSASGDGAVVVGPSSSSEDGGAVAAVRGGDAAATVSTLDVTDSAAGRVVVPLVVAQQAAGTVGSWGTSRGADGALPQ